jgi:hypothetical protein
MPELLGASASNEASAVTETSAKVFMRDRYGARPPWRTFTRAP